MLVLLYNVLCHKSKTIDALAQLLIAARTLARPGVVAADDRRVRNAGIQGESPHLVPGAAFEVKASSGSDLQG